MFNKNKNCLFFGLFTTIKFTTFYWSPIFPFRVLLSNTVVHSPDYVALSDPGYMKFQH